VTSEGLAWALSVQAPSGGRGTVVVAVLDNVILLRGIDERWRVGSYASAEDSDTNAARMTDNYEKRASGRIIAGPTVFRLSDGEAMDLLRTQGGLDKKVADTITEALGANQPI
jgi:hypothetical protein